MTIGGDFIGELSFGTFDEWLAALFYGNWATHTLTVGLVRHTFSVQKAFTDVISPVWSFSSVELEGELPSGGKRDVIQAQPNWTVAKVAPTIKREAAATL